MTFDEWFAKDWPDYDEAGDQEGIRGYARTAWDAAVAAERERCAGVADNAMYMLIGHANHSYGENAHELAFDIAKAIREGTEGVQ